MARGRLHLPLVTCSTDYIGRVRRGMSFHYDLDGPAHLDPLSTGTGIFP
eukprot:COSAG05_NODE_1000_length_6247_cov_23.555628_9_plen_49_part_00